MSYDEYQYSIRWNNPRVSRADSLHQEPHPTHDAYITQETRLIKAEWLLGEVKEYLRKQTDSKEAQTLLQKIEGEL